MKYNPDIHPRRRSIRLKGYDYSRPGAYFVTICTQDRQCLFGKVVDGEMRLNRLGAIAHQCWQNIPGHFPHVALDTYVIMPNHVHGIIWIVNDPNEPTNDVGAKTVGAKNFSPLRSPNHAHGQWTNDDSPRPLGTSKTIGSIVRGFKIGVTKWARQHGNIPVVWERNYYEHIVRDENELNRIREYINNNPLNWAMDQDNPNVRTTGRSPQQQDESWRI